MYGARLLLFARQQTRSEADAEDVLQDAFVRIWKTGDEPSLPKLFTAIRRAAIDLGRQMDRRSVRETKVAESSPDTFFEQPLEAKERAELLENALRTLPAAQQEVVMLKIWGELTFDEIARVVDASPHTVASRYRYALQTLRSNLHLLHQ